MTTIATDGKSMAADGQMNRGNRIDGYNTQKIFRLKDSRIIGMCGCIEDFKLVIAWIEGECEKPKVQDGFCALILSSDGIETMSDALAPYSINAPTAIGSGSDFAMGAMMAGAFIEEAVKIACLLDVYSGGKITVEHI